jgi:hypothetical protein
MLQKTLRFDDDVLSVFRNMIWSDDGLTGDITWQLDAGMYKKVKKALEALGGRWDKKAKIHRFDADPRLQVIGLVQNGTLKVDRDGFFRTPPTVTRKLLGYLDCGIADYNWLEPEAGDGAIVRVLIEEGFMPDRIYCIEQNAKRCDSLRALGVHIACGDFMRYKHSSGLVFNRILMNPPFEQGQDADHVRKAYTHLAKGGRMAAIVCEGIFFRLDNKAQAFRKWLKSVGAYDEQLPDKSFHESGTDVATRFIVVEK